VQRYYYDSHEQLRAHLADFLAAYNFAKRLPPCGPTLLLGGRPYMDKWNRASGSIAPTSGATGRPIGFVLDHERALLRSPTPSFVAALMSILPRSKPRWQNKRGARSHSGRLR